MNHGLTTVSDRLLSVLQRHPKRITALVAAVLLGGGGGAYAVASLAPDPADLPIRQITESVQPLSLQEQANSLDTHSFNLFRTETTRSSDTAKSLLQRLGIDDADAAAFLRSDALASKAVLGRAGRTVHAEASDNHALQRLSVRWNPGNAGVFERLVIEKTPQGFRSRIEEAALQNTSRLAGGTIRSSLFAATDEAGIPDPVATQIAEIFSGDIDFHRALRKGDHFSVVYETAEADGQVLRSGRVLSAEFTSNGKTYQAMWFAEPGQKGGYYTLDGQSLRRSFLASPVEFSRITSGFSMRMHPILQKWRAHLGVDYAASTGTSVRTVGDGVVEFAGVQNGYGNVIIVKHRNQNETVYAHLSRIDVRPGQSVSQGDHIGAVGSTGWATGPHLHFEFRVNGVHQDPLTVARQNDSQPVSTAAKPAFNQLASIMRLQLSAATSIQQASAD
ncbi:Murein DD-endopeptidase MepM and murein hydrolase activator NlpD, contain LysM domain [Rhodoferax sp. OV413]|uniref:M23 family metallopeptidase n=1 Tax=Rhodoferax sp. OV413 TaxID=1855285 RepID=UPI0008913DE1|nr:M23 family metallopeptidase [Rhodoferax sp. OV413]SDP26322.1 Murein DD-endopeptidase MepM and murein hydrolase activator NlpD, contain LysM domain [Rhodoferax sp. OV413]